MVTDLAIDTTARTARARLQLHGDPRIVRIRIDRYRVARTGRRLGLTVLEANASPAWVDVALREFLVGRRFSLPPTAASLSSLLVTESSFEASPDA